MPAYSDTLGERQKCHCKGGVTVTTYTLLQDKKAVIVGISMFLLSGEHIRSFSFSSLYKKGLVMLRVLAALDFGMLGGSLE